jgi:hypothetical protein
VTTSRYNPWTLNPWNPKTLVWILLLGPHTVCTIFAPLLMIHKVQP